MFCSYPAKVIPAVITKKACFKAIQMLSFNFCLVRLLLKNQLLNVYC